MSKANLDTYAVYDPRLVLDNKRQFAILKGGQNVTYYSYPASSFSATSWAFTTNPPSKKTILDRLAFIEVVANLTFSGDGLGSGDNILQPGRDALRSFPISTITDTLRVAINGFPVTIQMSDIIHLLERFHNSDEMKKNSMSYFPSMCDNVQVYSDADGWNNNPLGQFGDNSNINPRGAYSLTVVSNTTTSAVIQIRLREPIMLPPFIMDGIKNQHGGLVNLDSLEWNFTLSNNLARMWSRSTANTQNLSTIAVTFEQPNLQLGWITPNLTQAIPEVVTYPYFQINRYVTQSQADLASNASVNLTSNVIQFDSIPRKLYIYAQQSRNVIDSSLANTVNTPDAFMKINSVNINWDNQTGLLSSATPLQLYNISAQNGLNMSFDEFNGLTQELSAVGATRIKGLAGSVLCLELAKDLAVRSDQAPGSLSQINFQVTLNVTNVNQGAVRRPDLYVVAVYDGILEVGQNSARAYTGVITPADVLDARNNYDISYSDVQKVYGGESDFFSRFKEVGKKLLPLAKDVNKALRETKAISTGLKGVSGVASLVPHPYGQAAAVASKIGSDVAESLGYGQGGVLMGGMSADYSEMRKRLSKGRSKK